MRVTKLNCPGLFCWLVGCCCGFFALPATAADCAQTDLAACASTRIEAAYTADILRNARGGVRPGFAYLDNLDLIADFDGADLLGVRGLTAHAHVMYNNGREFGARFVGESQLVSNIEGVNTWRLYEFWVDYSFGKRGENSLRLGLYDLNTEFDSMDSAGLFLNSSHGIGAQLAQTGRNGPSIFPITSLGLRWRGHNGPNYWQVVALDAVPGDRHDPGHTGIHFDSDEAALLVAEAGSNQVGQHKFAVGIWQYTGRFDSIDETDAFGAPVSAKGNQGWYLLGERRLWKRNASELTVFARAGTAPNRFNPIERFWGGGLVWSKFLKSRPEDQLGLAIATASNSRRYRNLLLANGTTANRDETILELTWRLPVNSYLTLQPDLQWVRNPGWNPQLTDAWVVALRFELSSNWSR